MLGNLFDPRAREILARTLVPDAKHAIEISAVPTGLTAGQMGTASLLPPTIWPTAQKISWHPDTYDGALPFPDQSQDLLIVAYVLERMPMSHLYMLCAEARRTLRSGGQWALLAYGPRDGWLGAWWARLSQFWLPFRPLELTHYLSPEDWRTEAHGRWPRWGLCSQALVLRREG